MSTASSLLAVERRRTRLLVANPGIDPSGGCWTKRRLEADRACPRRAEHVYGPAGYVAWHEWAERARRHLRQLMCDCGFYMLAEGRVSPDA